MRTEVFKQETKSSKLAIDSMPNWKTMKLIESEGGVGGMTYALCQRILNALKAINIKRKYPG